MGSLTFSGNSTTKLVKMKLHMLIVPAMILLIFNGGEVHCRSMKQLLKQVMGKVETIRSHTELLVSNVVLPDITIKIDTAISFNVEIEDIVFTDSVNCQPILLNEVLISTQCSAPIPRQNCLI